MPDEQKAKQRLELGHVVFVAVEVKHGIAISLVNLYADVVGSPEPPAKFKAVPAAVPHAKSKRSLPWYKVVLAALLVGVLIAGIVLVGRDRWARRTGQQVAESEPPDGPSLPVPPKSIAVLPFENLSSDKANAFFADGVQDEILTDLAKIAGLQVISRTSVMQYKTGAPRNLRAIGQELGVAHVVEGSVQGAGNKVRVNAQLIVPYWDPLRGEGRSEKTVASLAPK